MIVVLQTGGKGEDVDWVKVKLFTDKAEAEQYCKENTDDPMNSKYWSYCEIIDEDRSYEVSRYENYTNPMRK